jgi:uncharacterized repeat protein (TIGR02543 family)
MKKLSFYLITFLLILLASCKNSFVDNSKIAYITLSVDEERTVLPSYASSDMRDFVLSGKYNGKTVVLGEFETASQVRNSTIAIETGTWDFSLSAKNGNNSFISNINSYNITNGNNSLTFNLKIVEDDIKAQDGNGSLSINFILSDDNNVHHVKAGLFAIDTDTAVNGFELMSIQNSNNYIFYSKQSIIADSYRFKAFFYADENETLLLDTYKEIVVIAASFSTSKNITIKNLNKVYTVTYNTNGAAEVAAQSFTKFSNDIVLQPVAREGYSFEGWYTESTFDNKITTIPADSAKDFSLYARWGIIVNHQTVDSFSSDSTLYNVVHYEGDLSVDDLETLCDNIPENSVLDLSAATGRTSINYKSYADSSFISYFSPCKKVVLPECLTDIAGGAFSHCILLKEIIIPDSVSSIGTEAFSGCSSLKEISIPEGVTNIISSAFKNCSLLERITLPEGITCIEFATFSGCRSLTEVTIPKTVTIIERFAFEYCRSLTEVTIPGSVTSIQSWAFSRCSSLQNVVIQEGITAIPSSMFYECSSLTEISIPSSINSISSDAFYNCSNLKTIHFAGTKSQWKSAEWNSYFPTGAKIYCTDGNISL